MFASVSDFVVVVVAAVGVVGDGFVVVVVAVEGVRGMGELPGLINPGKLAKTRGDSATRRDHVRLDRSST